MYVGKGDREAIAASIRRAVHSSGLPVALLLRAPGRGLLPQTSASPSLWPSTLACASGRPRFQSGAPRILGQGALEQLKQQLGTDPAVGLAPRALRVVPDRFLLTRANWPRLHARRLSANCPGVQQLSAVTWRGASVCLTPSSTVSEKQQLEGL